MIAYTSYYNPKVHNKDTNNTIKQSVHRMNTAQQYSYLDLDDNPIALDASMMPPRP